ncbi:MAG: hypothetical protein ABFS22_08135 [Pseudomonadota bacterium]
MKNILKTVAGIMVLTAGSISAEAADYSDFSNEELVQQRSQVRELAPEDRESYRTEMQSRMQSMSSNERALFREMNNMGGQGDGSGKTNRYGQGSGNGSGNMHRYGQGNSNGSGNMHRYGQGDSQGYGSGYGSRLGGGNGGGRRNR